ncbi:hypothetical protein GCM10010219_65140 [Streptomyces netropsis]|nr:hypothetical protein GCM10010219_65140 [Streptomyces netropsis]
MWGKRGYSVKAQVGTGAALSLDITSVGLNGSGNAVICQGDTGGPALRDDNGVPELVAVNSLSWQGGYLGTDPAETRTSVVDDLAAWIRQTAFRVQDDFTNDGIADLMAIWEDGTLHLYKGDGDGQLQPQVKVHGRQVPSQPGWPGSESCHIQR